MLMLARQSCPQVGNHGANIVCDSRIRSSQGHYFKQRFARGTTASTSLWGSLMRQARDCHKLRAIQVSGPGSTPPEQPAPPDALQGQVSREIIAGMKASITEALQAEQVDIVDVHGDGRHVGIDVISSSFEGLTSVKRQRLVYKAIWQELQNTVHAVDAMTTKTPQEAGL